MRFHLFHKRKKIYIDLKKTNFISKGIGLTFKSKNTSNLLFEFPKKVTWQGNLTSIFVFFPFIALWLDSKNKVIHKKIIKPFKFSISLNKPFNKIVEIPINVRNKKIIKNFLTEGEFKRYFPN